MDPLNFKMKYEMELKMSPGGPSDSRNSTNLLCLSLPLLSILMMAGMKRNKLT